MSDLIPESSMSTQTVESNELDPRVEKYLAFPPDIFNNILQNYEDSKTDNMIEEPEDMQEVLDALLELQDLEPSHVPNFEEDCEMISKAIQVNKEMQRKVEKIISLIDERLETNENHMKEGIRLALVENRFGKQLGRKIIIHKRYNEEVSYFNEDELIKPAHSAKRHKPNNDLECEHGIENESSDEDQEEVVDDSIVDDDSEDEEEEDEEYDEDEEEAQNNADNEKSLQSKAWSKPERDRLAEGIRSEAIRILSFDYVKRNEPWKIWEVDKMTVKDLESFPVERIDWQRISSLHVHTRSPTECLIQWTTQEHPSINKKPWSKMESEELSRLVDEAGLFKGQWEQIANKLGTNRTIAQCFSHYMSGKNNAAARSLKWTPEEDKKLKDAVKIFGTCNWQHVASILKGRTGQQCLHRWVKSLNPAIIRRKWNEEEDKLLKRAVQLYGVGKWTQVQRLVPGRTDMQCRERWVNCLHPSVKKTKITPEETHQLFTLVAQFGPKWSYIARMMPGRTDSTLMRHYNRIKKLQDKTTNDTDSVDKPVERKAAAKKSKAQQSGTKKSTTEKSVTEKTAEEEPIVEKKSTQKKATTKTSEAEPNTALRRSTRIKNKPT